MLLGRFKSLLLDPPPGMVFEVSEAGIAAARIGARTELDFQALNPGVLVVAVAIFPMPSSRRDLSAWAGT